MDAVMCPVRELEKLPTYPSPKPTSCPKWEVSVNVGLTFCAVFKRISVVLQYSYPPYIVHLPASLWHFIKGALNQLNMVCHTYNGKKKNSRVFYLVLRAAFSCWSYFLIDYIVLQFALLFRLIKIRKYLTQCSPSLEENHIDKN